VDVFCIGRYIVLSGSLLLTQFAYCAGDFVSTLDIKSKKILSVDPRALSLLAEQAFVDVSHLLRPAHLQVRLSFAI